MAKKKTKFDAVKSDPLFQGKQGLLFDGMTPDEVIELTDEQKATGFMSRFLTEKNPIGKYKEYFTGSVKGEAWELREIKNFYKRLVTTEKWSEEKFVTVIENILSENQILTEASLDYRGKLYEQGRLKPDSGSKPENSRRRGRI